MSFHAVEISFPFAYQPPLWRHKPGKFLAHFMGHEGPGSLHSYLKSKGWLTGLSAGPQGLGRGFAMFKITIHLTDDGFRASYISSDLGQNYSRRSAENYRSVILAAFKYLSLLRSSAFPAWYQKEIAAIAAMRFRFTEKRKPEDYAVWVSDHMVWPVPPELLISAPQLVWEWDEGSTEGLGEKQVRDLLEGLRVDRGRAVLMARAEEHRKISGTSTPLETEPWYGTVYKVEKFDEDFMTQVSDSRFWPRIAILMDFVWVTMQAQGPNDIPELFLPGPNEFIPTNLDVDKQEVAEVSRSPFVSERQTA
jgi:insulysin